MAHTRRRISLETPSDVARFVSAINSDGTADKFILENKDASLIVDARSLLGAMYASAEFYGEIYLVNRTTDGVFPVGLTDFSF